MQKAAHAYLQTQVSTVNRGQLLILLYDGAIKYLSQAKEKIQVRDVAAKGILISKALDIINELSSSLNKEKGGEIADSLNKLYFFCNSRLLMANLKLDCAMIDQVITILQNLRDAYAEIVAQGATIQETAESQFAEAVQTSGMGTPGAAAAALLASRSRLGAAPAPRASSAYAGQAAAAPQKPAQPPLRAVPKPGEASAQQAAPERPPVAAHQEQPKARPEEAEQAVVPGSLLKKRLAAYGAAK